ncbi:MAG TPA: glucose 1-dehydrogenase [Ktedonosporobacter sp.]|nr:glucose 1-dehydrogenase [Ktedonosporobacter sp.]
MRLQGKTALVTGATSGIGEAIAQAFAREGAKVVIAGRHRQRGQAVAQTIRKAGGEAHVVLVDLANVHNIDHLIVQTRQAVGSLDILVNNAGMFPMAATAQIEEATFDSIIATNLKAPFYLVAAFAPQMVERGSGKIINITTVLAHKGSAGASVYGATKAALTLLTKSWAAEFGPGGVNVNAIAPHLVRTAGIEENMEGIEQAAKTLPARRWADPAEVAAAAVYLASAEANFVHGVTLPVDGGYLAI